MTQNDLRTLGRRAADLVLSLRAENRDIVTAADIIERVGSETAARSVIQRLHQKGWLLRLRGGRYLLIPPEYGPDAIGENNALALASAVIEPSYVGWWSAASFHRFTPQKPSSVTVATTQRSPTRELEGTEVRFVTLLPRKFFGYDDYPLFGRRVVVSTPAKTVVDCADRPELCGGAAELARIVFGASSHVEPRALVDAARKMESSALVQRLGYLIDLVGWTLPGAMRAQLQQLRRPSQRAILGRKVRGPDDVGYVPEWGLFVHARESELLGDVPRKVRVL